MTVYDQRCEPGAAAVAHPASRTPTSTDAIAVDIDVAIGDGSIRFLVYPYQPASVFPTGVVVAADVRDADPTSAPPEVRRTTGETLFIPAPAGPALRRFCQRNRIPLRRRPDLWAALLEPFVDTEFTPERQRHTTARLARFGLSGQDVDQIRGRFAPAMRAYNSVAWDWCHLGLADLLDALHGHLAGAAHKLEPSELTETHAWAMALADRSGCQAAPSADGREGRPVPGNVRNGPTRYRSVIHFRIPTPLRKGSCPCPERRRTLSTPPDCPLAR